MFEQMTRALTKGYSKPSPLGIKEGDIFRRLTATDDWKRDDKSNRVRRCVCICGEQTWVKEVNLMRGTTGSCGCLRREMARASGEHARARAHEVLAERKRTADGKFLKKDT